jgi:hypothetical protein
MLRPAIIGSIKARPDDRHILHCLRSTSAIFRDIQSLEIVEFEDGKLAKAFDYEEYCKLIAESRQITNKYGKDINIIELISESSYESENAPYNIENGKYIATSNRIELSRQEIWCQAIGVPFGIDNYDIKFFPSELEFVDKVIKGFPDALVIHLKSIDAWRTYHYADAFIEYFAKKWDGNIILLDHVYKGLYSNVIELKTDIRKVWAVISKCKALIGIDSFGIHASGSTGVFTYGMFGPTDAKCRLLYSKAVSSSSYNKCGLQPCWYKPCRHVPCLNARKPSWYWDNFNEKKRII